MEGLRGGSIRARIAGYRRDFHFQQWRGWRMDLRERRLLWAACLRSGFFGFALRDENHGTCGQCCGARPRQACIPRRALAADAVRGFPRCGKRRREAITSGKNCRPGNFRFRKIPSGKIIGRKFDTWRCERCHARPAHDNGDRLLIDKSGFPAGSGGRLIGIFRKWGNPHDLLGGRRNPRARLCQKDGEGQ